MAYGYSQARGWNRSYSCQPTSQLTAMQDPGSTERGWGLNSQFSLVLIRFASAVPQGTPPLFFLMLLRIDVLNVIQSNSSAFSFMIHAFFVFKNPHQINLLHFLLNFSKFYWLCFTLGWFFSFSFFPLWRILSVREGPGAQLVWLTCRNYLFIVCWDQITCEKLQGWTFLLSPLLRTGHFCSGLLVYPWHLHQTLYMAGRWLAHSQHVC